MGTDPSPVPRRLVEALAAVHPLPGGEGKVSSQSTYWRVDLRLRGLRLSSPVASKSRRAGVQALRYIFRWRAASSAARGSD
jgi:hypothetical protein